MVSHFGLGKSLAIIAVLLAVLVASIIGCGSPPVAAPHSHDFGAAPDHSHAEPRSPQWPKVRAAYLAKHPLCECCGEDGKTTGGLETHHCQSFHEHPELELDPTNLIALCRRCHLLIGHLADFKRTNGHVREDAALIRKRIEAAKAGD